MDVVTILPHHLRDYMIAYYSKKLVQNWYDNTIFNQHGKSVIYAVTTTPSQLIQIVTHYDSLCLMCPKNPMGDNYVQPEDECIITDLDINGEYYFAKTLGISSLVNKESVTAQDLFKLLDPFYQRFKNVLF